MTEIPIACTLDRAQLRRRGEDIRALGRAALTAVERSERQAVLRFRPDPEIHEQVKAIAAAESECCAFLDFTVAQEPGATVVTIASPPDGAPILHELVDLFSADADRGG
jgi:hypothetical protein